MCLCANQFSLASTLALPGILCVCCVCYLSIVCVCYLSHHYNFHWLRHWHFQVQLSGGRKGKILINTMSSTHRGGYSGRDFKGRPFAKPLSRDYYDDGVGPLRRRFSHGSESQAYDQRVLIEGGTSSTGIKDLEVWKKMARAEFTPCRTRADFVKWQKAILTLSAALGIRYVIQTTPVIGRNRDSTARAISATERNAATERNSVTERNGAERN